jgi:hypothetical protein
MPKGSAKFASSAFLTLLAGIPFATTSHGETVADKCIFSPKSETPTGYHWYYRFDHTEKRNCWYLRQEGSSLSQAAPRNILPPAAAPVSRPPSPVQSSMADARAEVRGRGAQDDATNLAGTLVTPREIPPPTSSTNSAAPAVVAARWPELPPTGSVLASQRSTSIFASDLSRESSRLPPVSARPAPLVAAASAVPGEPGTIKGLIVATMGTLAFAGTTAVFVSRRGRVRRLRRSDVRYTQGPAWEMTDDTRIILSDHRDSVSREYRPRFARHAEKDTKTIGRAGKSYFGLWRVRPT